MQFKQGVRVVNFYGEELGSVERVVIDPHTKEVTHIIIRKGFFFTEDKVVPINLIATSTASQVTLKERTDLHSLPPFEESHYIPAVSEDMRGASIGMASPMLGYPPIGMNRGALPYMTETQRNIPDNTVALRVGVGVLSDDGEHVGNVEQVFTDSETNRATHLVISQGLLVKEHKLIPVSWVDIIMEDQVRLAVSSKLIETLLPYHETVHS